MRHLLRFTVGLVAMLLFATAWSPIASSNPPDQTGFLNSVRQLGVPLNDDQGALQLGYLVCAGSTSQRTDNMELVPLLNNQSWPVPTKLNFVALAQQYLCP